MSWIDVISDATKQAQALGSAYLLMRPDGSLKLLDPGSILLKPKEKDEIVVIQASTAGMTAQEFRNAQFMGGVGDEEWD